MVEEGKRILRDLYVRVGYFFFFFFDLVLGGASARGTLRNFAKRGQFRTENLYQIYRIR